MPKEIFPSSYECDCGHQSDFSENTIKEIKAMSLKRRVLLGDSDPDKHTIVFLGGRMVEILCPKADKASPARGQKKAAAKTRRSERDKQAKPKYTHTQGQYLAFIHLYMRLHRQAPAETDMQRYFRVSPPSVHQMVVTLERRGLIQKIPRQGRSITLLVHPDDLPELEPVLQKSTGNRIAWG